MDDIKVSAESASFLLGERLELQRRINRVKIMLWANDHLAARQELAEITEIHGMFFAPALEVKKKLTSIYKKSKWGIREQCRAEGLEKRDLAAETQERLAQMLHLHSEIEDALYLFSPMANAVERLSQRLRHDVRESIHVDEQSGFRLALIPLGQRQWEMRAYRFDAPTIDVKWLIRELENRLDGRLIPVEDEEDDIEWPLWRRLFLDTAYLELKFYTYGRFSVAVTGSRETSMGYLQAAILASVCNAQVIDSKAKP